MTKRKLRAWDPTSQSKRRKREYEKARIALRAWLNKTRAKHGLAVKEYSDAELDRWLWSKNAKRTERENRFHEMDAVPAALGGVGEWAGSPEIDPARAAEHLTPPPAAWIKQASDFTADLTPIEHRVHVLMLFAWWYDAHPDDIFLPEPLAATLSFPDDWSTWGLERQVSFMCWFRLICTGYHSLLGLPPDDKTAVGFRLDLWADFLSTTKQAVTKQAVKDAQGRIRAKGVLYNLPNVF